MAPDVPRRAVEIAVGPTVIRGQQWGTGANWVVLVHDVGADLDVWRNLPAGLTRVGYAVLLIDLPGHGFSDDPWEPEQLPDVLTAASVVARQHGAARVFLIASGQVAGRCLALPELDIDALVALSPTRPVDIGPLRATQPVLFLAGSTDPDAFAATQAVFAASTGPAVLSAFPVSDQGTDLLQTVWADHIGEHVALFFRPFAVPF